MKTKPNLIENLSARLIAVLLVALCLVIGAAGLVLPIIPGLLFLAIAVLICARAFPSLERWLRRSRTLDRHLDRADGFMNLSLWRKVQFGSLLSLKILLDSIACIAGKSRGPRAVICMQPRRCSSRPEE